MDSFIPPPFPFPEAWPRIFADQQQRQENRWLTSITFDTAQWHAPKRAENDDVLSVSCNDVVAEPQDIDDDEEDNGDYKIEYVLSDEWQAHFQSSSRLQHLRKQERSRNTKSKRRHPPQKQVKQPRHTDALKSSRLAHLQHEIQAAKARALMRKSKPQEDSSVFPSDSKVAALETSLNALFDEFCDAFEPVMWPHDALQS
ncbi:uncharacterized protein PHALS_08203 [Plasmopara halstedii]|uniref:Uncharacterized protein n=1 Tax=Plasmopara halstedii TaxID=4781 RepID=A0A0P1AC52_PLAHL|nr:uncharacterized protein PHALS_08203 [Plasmopara halstedii]CEG38109.1 hypothetical protein PHALS_08203 [Plasmopara halstedii]|eukprot:XP_024574478.1 hypothetical protein PHALS_08203 [Plasmopara halstedii]